MDMQFVVDSGAERRMGEFFAGIGAILANKRRRESFAIYAMGLLADGERKSAEPLAARACGDPSLVDMYHQRLLHFLGDSDWSDEQVRLFAAQYAIEAMTSQAPTTSWIIDDTGFLKQGTHSVGVQRQYTGSAGKITNCQIGVSLSIATDAEHVPVDFELYLPESWTEDPKRRRECHIPEHVVFKTKHELGLDMLRRAVTAKLPRGIVLADSAYGNSSDFRAGIRQLGLDYAVEIQGPTKVWRVDKNGEAHGEAIAVADLARQIGSTSFRRVTWREGTKGKLWSRFALRRALPVNDASIEGVEPKAVWLLMEWMPGEPTPQKFFLATLPQNISMKKLVRRIKERYRTERAYEDLKGELGLDHFEGRSFRGWHHHVSVALCCFAFVVAERVRRFSPQSRQQEDDHPFASQARTPLPRLLHHRTSGLRPHHRYVASALPSVPQAQQSGPRPLTSLPSCRIGLDLMQ